MSLVVSSHRGHVRLSALVAVLTAGIIPAPPAMVGADVVEPRTGVRFPEHRDGMSLLGTGVRTKTFLGVKVYAIGLYVSDVALAGPLARYRGRTTDPAFYRELVTGDFAKEFVMVFVRAATAGQVRDGFYEALPTIDHERLDLFSAGFGTPRKGDAYVLRWAPGGVLETTAAGQQKPSIKDKAFSTAVFAIWLGDKPLQQDIKRGIVARAGTLLR
jgi:chalcone isomerase-like protein